MDRIDGRPVYSATDLVGYLACEHLTQLERAALAGLVKRPMRDDPELDVIRKRGLRARGALPGRPRGGGPDARSRSSSDGSIDRPRRATCVPRPRDHRGDGRRRRRHLPGHVLRRHAGAATPTSCCASTTRPPVAWGPWHYEVADTKLARHVKASAVLQICSYIDQLERIQGVRPEWMHVALGGSARAVERLRVDDYMAYYRSARDRFLATIADDDATDVSADRRPIRSPSSTATSVAGRPSAWRAGAPTTTSSLVAGITARQRRALDGARRRDARGARRAAAADRRRRSRARAPARLERVREQARLQLEGARDAADRYELLLPGPGDADRARARAGHACRRRRPGDLFFDIEGDPYALDDGLDYLFGVLDIDGTFHAIWSRDDDGEFTLDGERRAFERLIDFVMERLARDPDLHIYHYAPYEPTALKRLMGRYGTREDEVDRLLRGGVLVDLLRVVRQSLRASVESYSIKKLEPFYGFAREIDLRDAGSQHRRVRAVARARRGRAARRPTHLERIERYNRDDVVSNLRLRDWLEGRRDELAAADRRAGAAAGAARTHAARRT